MSKRRLKINQLLGWLPVMAVAVLTIVLAMKWSIASQRVPRKSSPGARTVRSLQPDLLFRDAVSETTSTVQAGNWTMPNSNLNFENETVSAPQLSQALRQNDTAELGGDLAEHLALIDLIPAQRAKVERRGSVTTRSIDFATVQASLSYREIEGRTYFISAKVANRVDADRWQLITLSPKHTQSQALVHLLPIEGVVASVCQRFSKTGSLQCEIVEAGCAIEDLVRNWSLHGWVVQPFSMEGSQDNTVWTCIQGSQCVHVRATPDETSSKLSLVMTALHSL